MGMISEAVAAATNDGKTMGGAKWTVVFDNTEKFVGLIQEINPTLFTIDDGIRTYYCNPAKVVHMSPR